MNRRDRRANGQRGPRTITQAEAIRRVIACPDCGSRVTVVEIAPGVCNAAVEHDETCPWFASFLRRRTP